MHRFPLIHEKLYSKVFFRALVMARLFKIQFSTKKFLAKIFIKIYKSQLIHEKLNSKGFWTPGDATFVQNSIFYKKVPSQNFHTNA